MRLEVSFMLGLAVFFLAAAAVSGLANYVTLESEESHYLFGYVSMINSGLSVFASGLGIIRYCNYQKHGR